MENERVTPSQDCWSIPIKRLGLSPLTPPVSVRVYVGYSAIVENLDNNPGIKGNDVTIVLHEPPMENWGIRGGRPASEVNLGFDVNV